MGKDKSSREAVYLIDATAFCYRAFYALRGLRTSDGQPTNAIYGFINMINKLLKENKPNYCAICFDVSRDTFRQRKFKEYKATRPAMPDTLSSQIPFIKEIIRAYNIACFEKEGFEADDIIATLASKLKSLGLSVVIISSDKDILQLVDEKIQVFSPYKDEGKLYSKKEILSRYGVEPEGIVDILALMGDDVDNIPGVPGIGKKTAVELIKEFKSLDNLIKNIENIKSKNIKNALKSNLGNINLSKELTRLDTNVSIIFKIEDLKMKSPDYDKLYEIFKRLEFKKMLKDLPIPEQMPPSRKNIQKLDNIKDFIKYIKEREVFLSCDYEGGKILFSTGEKSIYQSDILKGVSILKDPYLKKIGYNLKRLKLFLKEHKISLSGLYFDVMLAAYLIDPSKSDYSLESITWDYLKLIVKDLDAYSATEVITRLRPILEKNLKEKHLERLFYNIEMPLIEVLVEMEAEGIRIDLDILKSISLDIESRLIKLIEEIYEMAGSQFNINSPKQLREILFHRLNLPVVKKTKTGPSTDEEVLRQLTKRHPLPTLLLEYRQLMKLKSTYIDPLPQLINSETGRIHSIFNQVATETGRLTCSQPNLQNIPIKTEIGRRIRQAFVAGEPNSYLISADYSQIELRLLAHLSGDDTLISAFQNDEDVHKATACLIYGVDESDVTEQMRETAKRINFSIIYGLSPYGLSRDLEISPEQAQGFIESYFLRYPKVKAYLQMQIKKARETGFVSTISGRRRYMSGINNKNTSMRSLAERQAVNTPIQGSAADLVKQAMIDIYKAIKKEGLRSKMLVQIHDELLFEVDEKEIDVNIALIKDKMENVYKLRVPIKVNISVGKNWLQMQKRQKR